MSQPTACTSEHPLSSSLVKLARARYAEAFKSADLKIVLLAVQYTRSCKMQAKFRDRNPVAKTCLAVYWKPEGDDAALTHGETRDSYILTSEADCDEMRDERLR